MFAVGASVPLLTVAMLLTGQPGETNPAPIAQSMAAVEPLAVLNDLAVSEQTAAFAALPEQAQSADAAPVPAIAAAAEPIPEFDTLELIVARNDTLDALFRRNGLSISDLAEMLDIPLASEPLRRLMPGDRLSVVHDGASIVRLQRELRDDAFLEIRRDEDGFVATEIPREIEIRVVGRHGVVRSSLFEAGMAAEIPDAIIMRMAGIFQWDIDFILDVRVEDHFTLLYEERWREGEFIGTRSILAAEYVNRGTAWRIVRYVDPSGHIDYYNEEGRSVRKAFVRAPVEFSRISSNFNPNRRHPVLNTIRAHRGVDYAAPTGTPVIAAGDGRISQRGRNGGFGNSVTIQHGRQHLNPVCAFVAVRGTQTRRPRQSGPGDRLCGTDGSRKWSSSALRISPEWRTSQSAYRRVAARRSGSRGIPRRVLVRSHIALGTARRLPQHLDRLDELSVTAKTRS